MIGMRSQLIPRWNLDLGNINQCLDQILSGTRYPINKRGRPYKRKPREYIKRLVLKEFNNHSLRKAENLLTDRIDPSVIHFWEKKISKEFIENLVRQIARKLVIGYEFSFIDSTIFSTWRNRGIEVHTFARISQDTVYPVSIYFGKVSPSIVVSNVLVSGEGRALADRWYDDNKTYFYHPDHLGSTTLVTNSTGSVVEETNYKPYGEPLYDAQSRFLFTGKELDKGTRLQYFGARYYDPELARFVQPDSIIPDFYNPQALNRYSYTLNNPYKYTDPSGNIPAPVITTIAFAAIFAGYEAYVQYTTFGEIRDTNAIIAAGAAGATFGFTIWVGGPIGFGLASAGSFGAYMTVEEILDTGGLRNFDPEIAMGRGTEVTKAFSEGVLSHITGVEISTPYSSTKKKETNDKSTIQELSTEYKSGLLNELLNNVDIPVTIDQTTNLVSGGGTSRIPTQSSGDLGSSGGAKQRIELITVGNFLRPVKSRS